MSVGFFCWMVWVMIEQNETNIIFFRPMLALAVISLIIFIDLVTDRFSVNGTRVTRRRGLIVKKLSSMWKESVSQKSQRTTSRMIYWTGALERNIFCVKDKTYNQNCWLIIPKHTNGGNKNTKHVYKINFVTIILRYEADMQSVFLSYTKKWFELIIHLLSTH